MSSEAGNNCSGNHPSQVISSIGVEFKRHYIKIIDEKIAALKSEIAAKDAADSARKKNRSTTLARVKETRRKVEIAKIKVQDLKKTGENVLKTLKYETELCEMLQSDLNKYKADNILFEKEHKESIDDMENKWKTYQAQYETLPLAVERTEAKNKLSRDKVELMIKRYKLNELEEARAKKKEIGIMRRNSLVVECAQLFKEAKLEDSQLRYTLATEKNLKEEIRRQEQMIAELTEKQSQESAAASAEKSIENKFPFTASQRCSLPASQRCSQPLRQFDLSFPVETLTQPMPTFRKYDFDTISITSSVIDNLMEPEIPGETEADDNDQTLDAAVCDPRNKAFTVENDHRPSKDQIASNPIIEDKKESTERLEAELAMDEDSEMQEMEESHSPNHPNEDKDQTEYSPIPCDEAPKKKHGSNPMPQQELELRETERKKPKIINVETVKQPKNISDKKPLREDSLARFFIPSRESSVAYNWKDADYPSSIFDFKDSQKENAESGSIHDSEMSMQSEDITKRFHISFASHREDEEEYKSKMGENQKQFVTPQTNLPGPSHIGLQTQAAATPFINMVNNETPNSRGGKKKPFFLDMF